VNRRLHSFYAEFTSVDAILGALSRDRQEEGMVTAADLYTRSLNCQNQGGTPSVIARKFTVSLGIVVEPQVIGMQGIWPDGHPRRPLRPNRDVHSATHAGMAPSPVFRVPCQHLLQHGGQFVFVHRFHEKCLQP